MLGKKLRTEDDRIKAVAKARKKPPHRSGAETAPHIQRSGKRFFA